MLFLFVIRLIMFCSSLFCVDVSKAAVGDLCKCDGVVHLTPLHMLTVCCVGDGLVYFCVHITEKIGNQNVLYFHTSPN